MEMFNDFKHNENNEIDKETYKKHIKDKKRQNIIKWFKYIYDELEKKEHVTINLDNNLNLDLKIFIANNNILNDK